MTTEPNEHWLSTAGGDPVGFRKALGSFATGVTVVAAQGASGEMRAFTANSFTSVSLDPPLVLVCLAKNSASLELFSTAPAFSISILAAAQRDTSGAFASRDPQAKQAAIAQLRSAEAPYVGESLATFLCAQHQIIDAGDHVILLGRVTRYRVEEGEPLAFFRGAYVGIGAALREIEQLRAAVLVGAVLGQHGQVLLIRRPGTQQWVIPTVHLSSGARHDRALHYLFGQLGVHLDAAIPYSLFQEPDEGDTTLIFSVESDSPVQPSILADGTEIRFFGPDDPVLEKVGGVMKPGVLHRYLREMASGLFGVYFDSFDGGSVMPIHGKPVAWSNWYGPTASSDRESNVQPR